MAETINRDSQSTGGKKISERMLFVGPLPPPRTGTHVSFQVLCDEVRALSEPGMLEVIDTSQKQLKKNSKIASTRNLRQAVRVIQEFRRKLKQADHVLIFGSNGFVFSMTPILSFLARRAGKPCHVRCCGGSLDQFAEKLNPLFRRILFNTLRKSEGLAVETEYLDNQLTPMLGDKIFASRGRRYVPDLPPKPARDKSILRLVFAALVREEKGVFVLLESLRRLKSQGVNVHCDIYGEIWPASREQFEREIKTVDNATYKGVLEPSEVIPTIHNYDAHVLPTHYQGEGHPGILVESMMVGIPSITTRFRAIPELVEDGANGLLIPTRDPDALEEAIRKLATDAELLEAMSENSFARREHYDAKVVVPEYLKKIGVLR